MNPPPERAKHRPGLVEFLVRERGALGYALLLVLGMQLFEFQGWLAGAEGKVLDFYLLHFSSSSRLVRPVTTLEIDEKAYRDLFQDRSPLDAAGLLSLVDTVQDLGASVIGIDILTDSTVFEQRYQAWREGYRERHQNQQPAIVWAMGQPYEPDKGERVRFTDWITGKPERLLVKPTAVLGDSADKLPDSLAWGTPVFPRDEDLALRRYPRKTTLQGEDPGRPTWAAAVGQAYCGNPRRRGCGNWFGAPPDEVLLAFPTKPDTYKVSDLFRSRKCAPDNLPPGLCLEPKNQSGNDPWFRFAERVGRSVVLIGGTFGKATNTDMHDTPNGSIPGVELNAYAVQAEISGTGVREAAHPWLVLADLIFAVWIVYLFFEPRDMRTPIKQTFLLCAGVACVSYLLFQADYVWLSWIGIFAGMWLHIVLEVYQANPKVLPHGDEGKTHS